MQRLLLVANGRLLEGHRGAGQQAVVHCSFAAGADLEIHDSPAPLPTFATSDRPAAMRRPFRQSGNRL